MFDFIVFSEAEPKWLTVVFCLLYVALWIWFLRIVYRYWQTCRQQKKNNDSK